MLSSQMSPSFFPASWSVPPAALTRFRGCSGLALARRSDPPPRPAEARAWNAGGLRAWEGAGPCAAREVWSSAAAVREPVREPVQGWVAEPDAGTRLEMEFDCEGLRRLLGKVRAARRARAGARPQGVWGVSTRGRATS